MSSDSTTRLGAGVYVPRRFVVASLRIFLPYSAMFHRLLPPSAPSTLSLPVCHGWGDLSAVLRYCASILVLLGLRNFVLSSSVLPLIFIAEPRRTPRVRFTDFVTVPSPLLPRGYERISGGRCRRTACPPGQPYGASLSLETVTHLRLPPDLPSQAPRRLHPSAAASVISEQGPCLIGVGFPPSGPRVWTCTSYL